MILIMIITMILIGVARHLLLLNSDKAEMAAERRLQALQVVLHHLLHLPPHPSPYHPHLLHLPHHHHHLHHLLDVLCPSFTCGTTSLAAFFLSPTVFADANQYPRV